MLFVGFIAPPLVPLPSHASTFAGFCAGASASPPNRAAVVLLITFAVSLSCGPRSAVVIAVRALGSRVTSGTGPRAGSRLRRHVDELVSLEYRAVEVAAAVVVVHAADGRRGASCGER